MAKKKKAMQEEQNAQEVETQVAEPATSETSNENSLSTEEKLAQELAQEKDKFLRLFAEFENYKKRTTKERIDLFKTAGQDILQSLLPVLDDFDRAMVEISKTEEKELLKGVELIHSKLKEMVKAKGLQAVEAKAGDTFDAEIHEAVTQIPAPNEEMKGKIIDVIEKGYQLGDKVIRFPKVVVGQ